MSDGVKIAVIGGVFGLLGSVVGQLDKVHDILVSVGIKKATHVVQVSESPPPPETCNDSSDLGRVVLHSDTNGKAGIFFCPQGKAPDYQSPQWYIAKGVTVEDY